jgi:hypothetical protein
MNAIKIPFDNQEECSLIREWKPKETGETQKFITLEQEKKEKLLEQKTRRKTMKKTIPKSKTKKVKRITENNDISKNELYSNLVIYYPHSNDLVPINERAENIFLSNKTNQTRRIRIRGDIYLFSNNANHSINDSFLRHIKTVLANEN